MDNDKLKTEVKTYWNKEPCGTRGIKSKEYTREYFEEIEEMRYTLEPEIFSFAQFPRYHGKKILEVGVGAGTDFIQWVRSGTQAYGIDLSEESVNQTKRRLELFGLSAQEVRVADAEHLPFPDNTFDLVYSWGVIHHSPDTVRALGEIIRVVRVGGTVKVMIYNRRSLRAFFLYFTKSFCRGKPFRSVRETLYHELESIGTKAYTIQEISSILAKYPVVIKKINNHLTIYDRVTNRNCITQFIAYVLAFLFGGDRCGWFLTMELEKVHTR